MCKGKLFVVYCDWSFVDGALGWYHEPGRTRNIIPVALEWVEPEWKCCGEHSGPCTPNIFIYLARRFCGQLVEIRSGWRGQGCGKGAIGCDCDGNLCATSCMAAVGRNTHRPGWGKGINIGHAFCSLWATSVAQCYFPNKEPIPSHAIRVASRLRHITNCTRIISRQRRVKKKKASP